MLRRLAQRATLPRGRVASCAAQTLPVTSVRPWCRHLSTPPKPSAETFDGDGDDQMLRRIGRVLRRELPGMGVMFVIVFVIYGSYDYYSGGWVKKDKYGEPIKQREEGLPQNVVKRLPNGDLLLNDGSIVRSTK